MLDRWFPLVIPGRGAPHWRIDAATSRLQLSPSRARERIGKALRGCILKAGLESSQRAHASDGLLLGSLRRAYDVPAGGHDRPGVGLGGGGGGKYSLLLQAIIVII